MKLPGLAPGPPPPSWNTEAVMTQTPTGLPSPKYSVIITCLFFPSTEQNRFPLFFLLSGITL